MDAMSGKTCYIEKQRCLVITCYLSDSSIRYAINVARELSMLISRKSLTMHLFILDDIIQISNFVYFFFYRFLVSFCFFFFFQNEKLLCTDEGTLSIMTVVSFWFETYLDEASTALLTICYSCYTFYNHGFTFIIGIGQLSFH